MHLYDIAPNAIVEVEEPIGADELEDARERYAETEDLDAVARRLGGRVHEPKPARPMIGVYVDALLEHVGTTEESEELLASLVGPDTARALLERQEGGGT